MIPLYEIEGCSNIHPQQLDGPEYNDPNYYPEFQNKLEEFKKIITDKVEKKEGFVVIRVYDGEFSFLNGNIVKGQRSKKINKKVLQESRKGCYEVDMISVQLNIKMEREFKKILPGLDISLPMDIIYGLVTNRWLLKKFKNRIGLIGGKSKIETIKSLMSFKEYQEYLENDYFTDYISVPETLSSDEPGKLLDDISDKIKNSKAEIFLFGIGIVKLCICYKFKEFKNCVFIDIGHAMSGLAGVADPERPYFGSWKNYRIKNYDYGKMDSSPVHTNLKNNRNTIYLD